MAAKKSGKKTSEKKAKTGDVLKVFESGLQALYKLDFAKALQSFEKVEKDFPEELSVVDRARIFQRLCRKRLEAGKSASDGKESAEVLFDLGVFHHNRGEFKEALKLFEKARKKAGKQDAHILYAMAATLVGTGEIEKALELLSEAISSDEAHRSYARNDPDFRPLAEVSEFQKLLAASD